ncbi:RhoGAP-domain-containing protein, partial [Ramicandelaber brevisporus]
LPMANYTLLRALIAHLIRVVRHHKINGMTLQNIGIVFGPTLMINLSVFVLFVEEFEVLFALDSKG